MERIQGKNGLCFIGEPVAGYTIPVIMQFIENNYQTFYDKTTMPTKLFWMWWCVLSLVMWSVFYKLQAIPVLLNLLFIFMNSDDLIGHFEALCSKFLLKPDFSPLRIPINIHEFGWNLPIDINCSNSTNG